MYFAAQGTGLENPGSLGIVCIDLPVCFFEKMKNHKVLII